MRILVAGASGLAGRQICKQLSERGLQPVALLRRPDGTFQNPRVGDLTLPQTLIGCCDGIDTVISSAGGTLSLGWVGQRHEYFEVDWLGNRNLLREAVRAGVRKFIYVSLQRMANPSESGYAHFHERFGTDLCNSGIEHTVVRPTGFFGFIAKALEGAAKGRVIVVGSGAARTNPIHESDVARACVEAIHSPLAEMPVGGPEIFTRKSIAELALSVAGQKGKPMHVPEWIMRAILPPLRILHPRLFDFYKFGVEVSVNDCIAPAYGQYRLEDYLREAWKTS